MDQLQSGRPANVSRRARRSLAEFALPANDASSEITSATPPLLTVKSVLVKRLSKQSLEEPGRKSGRARRRLIGSRNAAASGPRRAHREDAGQGSAAPVTIVEMCYAQAIELMTTNISTTWQYAERLLTIKTPTDFFQVSLAQVIKQTALIMEQTSTFASVAQRDSWCPNVAGKAEIQRK
jgi:hypothetical protein